ncbi:MAG: phenylpyruvate tautomerase MIF-related protein [Magnetospirillum sp.]|nr:phenylpyruvate tautomerase MIF-related protein [Magnetospirillum sp.]
MPMIRVETNQPVADGSVAAFLADLSRLAASALGKPEAYVMVSLDAGRAMLFAGTDAPAAYVEVKSIGLQRAQTAPLSQALSGFLRERLGVDPSRVYIEFAAAEGAMWGWNGGTF